MAAEKVSRTDITFTRRLNGYDKEEVDRYIESLSEAYQTAYGEYKSTCDKYNKLLEEYNTLDKEREQGKAKAEVLAKTLVDAETLAHKIVADAHAEGEIIKAEAKAALQKEKEEAYIEKGAAKIQARRILDEANAEAAAAKEEARRILLEAQEEKAKIGRYAVYVAEQADESVRQTLEKLQELLTYRKLPETRTEEKSEILEHVLAGIASNYK